MDKKRKEEEENIGERKKVGWEEAADFLLLHSKRGTAR